MAVSDIAAVAFHLLTDEKSHDTDYFVRGPELLSYDEVRLLADASQHCHCGVVLTDPVGGTNHFGDDRQAYEA